MKIYTVVKKEEWESFTGSPQRQEKRIFSFMKEKQAQEFVDKQIKTKGDYHGRTTEVYYYIEETELVEEK